ncbi:MAG: MBL fold metallo-hydrolase [Desulfovibrionaceae bacterium]|nr:MBL fold metallo-hydrolase [Desulfovibrionaceae bacterium]
MDIRITYIHHNCFVLQAETRTYLFDYPAGPHLPPGAADLVRRAVDGTDLAVFISHGHEDHCNGDLGAVTGGARRVRYVLSDDILELRPEAVPANGVVLNVEPDETYALDGMKIDTLMSNDLGVAFLVEDGPFRFYFGGDLAKWIWKSASSAEASFTADFFRRAMVRVRAFGPHVAFSNVDRRLDNLAGGAEAYRECGARVFVPMHAFGETGWLPGFVRSVRGGGPDVFLYANPGDSAVFSV